VVIYHSLKLTKHHYNYNITTTFILTIKVANLFTFPRNHLRTDNEYIKL